MGGSAGERVKRRRVFYVPGYDPFHPRRYRELYRKEAAAQAAVSGYRLSLSPAGQGARYGWRVTASMEGARVVSDIEVLVWSDIVRASMSNGIFATYWQLVKTVWVYVGSGAIFRLIRLRKGPAIAALYPIVMLIGQLALAAGVLLALRFVVSAGFGMAGGGALADIGSHALATAEYLCGPIASVMGDCVTVIQERPDGKGATRKVEVDDIGRAFLRFESGATGSIEGNWIATGRKMQHDFEVYGTKGALAFSQEHFNVLNFFNTDDARGRQGFRRIEAGPDHAPYGLFCVAPGHQLGFNDLKAIEVAGYVNAIAGKSPEPFNFRKGLRIQTLVETIQASSREKHWLDVT